MNSNRSTIPIAIGLALLLGWLVSPLDRSIANQLGQRSDVESLRSLESQFGQGISVAILGGYRSVAANLVWLSKNGDWEQRDIAGTLGKIALSTSIDPRPELFWLDGARVIANDMPTWVIGANHTDQLTETEEGRAIARQFAHRALSFLGESRSAHGANPAIYLEEAMILWKKAKDPGAAADRFEKALKTGNAPYFAYRVYAQLLVEMGRKRDALDLLRAHYRELPDNSVEAMKPVVAERIRTLANELEE